MAGMARRARMPKNCMMADKNEALEVLIETKLLTCGKQSGRLGKFKLEKAKWKVFDIAAPSLNVESSPIYSRLHMSSP